MTAKTVLIADDDKNLVDVLTLRCRRLGVRVLSAYDAMSALMLARRHRPDLVCLDVNMPSGSGLSVCEMLSEDDELRSIPAIILTGRTDEDTIRRCHAMCAYYVLKSHDIWQRMEPVVRELLDLEPAATDGIGRTGGSSKAVDEPVHRLDNLVKEIAREVVYAQVGEEDDRERSQLLPETVGPEPKRRIEKNRRPRVLYVEDDADESEAVKVRLEALGVEVIQAFSATEGYRLAVIDTPDVILCDFVMPDGEGDYALRRFKENPVTEDIPVVFLTGREGGELPRRLYGQGAAGFLTKPAGIQDIVEELKRFITVDHSRHREPAAV